MNMIVTVITSLITSLICYAILSNHIFNAIDLYVREMIELAKRSIRDKSNKAGLPKQKVLEALNEAFPTNTQTLKIHADTLNGLITNIIRGDGLNQFAFNDETSIFLLTALLYGRAALLAAPDISGEIRTEIAALSDFCKRYYGH